MEEMDELAKALMKSKSYKDRQLRLNKSLDSLSFKYPELYSIMFKEIKRRELEFNDPNKITKWLNTSNPDSYVKLHEALIFVKGHNIMAKEKYMDNLKQMFCHTIENRTNIEVVMKICSLIVKSPHLKTIHEHLYCFIQQIKQLNKHCNQNDNMWTDKFNQTHVDTFGGLKLQCAPPGVQSQSSTFWSTFEQPINLIATQSFPYFNLECVGYDHLEMTAISDRQFTLTIVSQEMDGAVVKWLRYIKLHKYTWFFNALSYIEIELIDENNIEGLIMKVNKNYITNGAKKKICLSTKTLRDRRQKLKDILMTLDLDVTLYELCEFITYMRDILHYPIPNKNCIFGDQIQQDIVLVMRKLLHHILEKLDATRTLVAHSLLGTSINKYLECSMLVIQNQAFTQDQIENMLVFVKTLKNKVLLMPK